MNSSLRIITITYLFIIFSFYVWSEDKQDVQSESEKIQYDKFTKPLPVPTGKLYAYEKLNKEELKQLLAAVQKKKCFCVQN